MDERFLTAIVTILLAKQGCDIDDIQGAIDDIRSNSSEEYLIAHIIGYLKN